MNKLKLKNVLLVTVILLALITGSFALLLINKNKYAENEKADTTSEKTQAGYDTSEMYESFQEETVDPETIPQDPQPEPLPQFSAWIAYWDFYGGLNSYEDNPEAFHSLSPTWYYQKEDGSLGLKNTARNKQLTALCEENNTLLIPSISNSNANSLSTVLNDEKLFNTHVKNIVNEVVSQGYDGIDIDYEQILAQDKDKFTNFIKTLSQKLHEKDKLITIAILWKNDLSPAIEIVSDSRAAQDWTKLSQYVDEFRIMAYDFTGSADDPGPIAPRDWIRSILDYAMKEVKYQDKIVLGLPLYAYDWTEEKPGAKALVWADVENVRKNYEIVSDTIQDDKMEAKLIYRVGGINRVIWYQDSKVTERRVELASTYGIKKFVFWRLGGEDPATF